MQQNHLTNPFTLYKIDFPDRFLCLTDSSQCIYFGGVHHEMIHTPFVGFSDAKISDVKDSYRRRQRC